MPEHIVRTPVKSPDRITVPISTSPLVSIPASPYRGRKSPFRASSDGEYVRTLEKENFDLKLRLYHQERFGSPTVESSNAEREELIRVTTQVNDLAQTLEQRESLLAKAKHAIDILEDKIKSPPPQTPEGHSRIIVDKIGVLQAQLANMQSLTRHKDEELQRMARELHDANTSLQRLKSNKTEELQHMETELHDTNHRYLQLQRSHSITESEESRLEIRHQYAVTFEDKIMEEELKRQQAAEISRQRMMGKGAVEVMEQKYEASQKMVRELEAQIIELKRRWDEIEQERSEREMLSTKNEMLLTEIEDLKKTIAKQKGSIDEAISQIEQYKAKTTRLASEVAASHSEGSRLKGQISSLESQIKDSNKRITKLQSVVQELELEKARMERATSLELEMFKQRSQKEKKRLEKTSILEIAKVTQNAAAERKRLQDALEEARATRQKVETNEQKLKEDVARLSQFFFPGAGISSTTFGPSLILATHREMDKARNVRYAMEATVGVVKESMKAKFGAFENRLNKCENRLGTAENRLTFVQKSSSNSSLENQTMRRPVYHRPPKLGVRNLTNPKKKRRKSNLVGLSKIESLLRSPSESEEDSPPRVRPSGPHYRIFSTRRPEPTRRRPRRLPSPKTFF